MSENRQRWQSIVAHYARRRENSENTGSAPYMEAVCALEHIALHAQRGGLAMDLFPWTSVDALCLQQVDVAPYAGPYLALTPLADGAIEFRYVDTAIERRQWKRIESPETALARLDHVIAPLHWRVDVQST